MADKSNRHAQMGAESGKLYVQIATLMRQRIANGAWQAGDRIATLDALAQEFGVAVVTVRQALTILERDGLIWRRQGKGTFVAEQANQREWIKLGIDWADMAEVWARTAPKILADVRRATLPSSVEIGYPLESYRFLRRLHFADDIPYAVLNIHLAREIWRRDRERFDTGMIINLMRELPDVEIGDSRQSLTISSADLEIAELLDIPPASPVGEVRRLIQAPNGAILYSALAVYRGDLVRLESVQR